MANVGGDLFTIVTRVSVNSELLSSPADLELKYVGTKQFFHCAKSCRKVMRVLLCKASSTLPSHLLDMTKTDIVEQLMKLKDQAFQQSYSNIQRGAMSEAASLDLGLETPTKTSRVNRYNIVSLMQMPETVSIHGPSLDGVDAIDLTVIATKPGAGLWLELTNTSLTYIASAVEVQLKGGCFKRSHPSRSVTDDDRIVVDVPGVSFSYKRNVYHASAVDADGRRKRQYTNDKGAAVEFVQVTSQSAW